MPEFSDVKVGDKFVAVHTSGARLEDVAKYLSEFHVQIDTVSGFSLEPEYGWTIESIEKKPLPAEPGSRINNVVLTNEGTYPFAVRTLADGPGDYHEWVVFYSDGDFGGVRNVDIKSWESA